MKCEAFREAMFDHLAGTLRDPAPFESHFASCPPCAAALRAVERNERILAAARVPAPPADLWERIKAGLPRPAGAFRKWIAWPAAAAALLLAVGLARAPRPAPPGLRLVVEDVRLEKRTALRSFMPHYEDDALAIMDDPDRSDP